MNSTKPKICIVSATPLTIHFFFKPHLRELSRFYDVSLIYNPNSDTYVQPLNVPVRELGVKIERKIAPLSDLITLCRLFFLFRKENFAAVITLVPKAGLLGMIASYLTQVPFRVHIFQGEVWASKKGPMRGLLKTMDKIIVRMATNLLAVSFGERKFLECQGVARPGQIKVLGPGSICGVDTNRFKPDLSAKQKARQVLGIPANVTVCNFLGRLHRDKGIEELVRAFQLVAKTEKNLWLLMVGPDEGQLTEQYLKGIPTEITSRVVLKSFTKEPENILRASDFLCLPSYREGFGMVVLEAAAVGIPAIGSAIYGISEAIEDNHTGILIPPRDISALAEAISKMCREPQERERLAKSALSRVREKFEEKKVVDTYILYLRNIIDNLR